MRASALVLAGLALVVAPAAALAVTAAPSTVIEPRFVHVDRSPPVGRPHATRPQLGQPPKGHSKVASGHDLPSPSKVVGGGLTDESVTFGVNTRGELGASHASLMCKCDVLSILIDEEDNERRSYTAPELRAHVPQVTAEYALKNKQVSFGVNVRGEEGNEFNPTWCNCQVQKNAKAANGGPQRGGAPQRGAPMRGAVQDEDGDEDGEDEELEEEDAPAAASPHRGGGAKSPHGMPASASMPHRLVREHLQLDEGASPGEEPAAAPAAAVEPAQPSQERHRLPVVEIVGGHQQAVPAAKEPTPAELAEGTINLQTEAGLTAAPAAAPGRHRHSWTHGADVAAGHRAVHHHHAAAGVGADEYMFHGHRYSASGERLDKPAGPTEEEILATSMMLAQLAEGAGSDSDVDANETKAEAGQDARQTAVAAAAATADDEPAAPTETATPSASASPSPSPSASAPADEDSDADDAMTALDKLRKAHPHTSDVLSRALSAAASQQEAEVLQYQHQLSEKDEVIRKLLAANEKEHARFDAELKKHEAYETQLLATESPSPTPSASAPASESSSPSSTPTASPSPSPSQSAPVPVTHYQPRVNRKACYDECKVKNCAGLFDQSLQQYTDCMEGCASTCYTA